ncbi:hypothetical protein NEOKW01_1258 [Nematocida sp. AWRm80]|nr:hypothetical protein NEOKW01_1258 [Nematocida sp. AWRm80]
MTEKEDLYQLLDIFRYVSPVVFPEDTPEEVAEELRKLTPEYLYDIYFWHQGSSVCALLHPGLCSRVLKGWLVVGAFFKILKIQGDMIVEIELVDGIESTLDIQKIKQEMYFSGISPIYNPKACYLPMFTDEKYLKWSTKWSTHLKEYPEENNDLKEREDQELNELKVIESTNPFERKGKRVTGIPGYTDTKNNVLRGRVLLKSKLFMSSKNTLSPYMFSFVLLTEFGLVKVFVWEAAVRRFFCIQENDSVLIKGFKIKRRTPLLTIADRTKTDADTRYSKIPSISVNAVYPVGYIFKLPHLNYSSESLVDQQFVSIEGVVQYISPLYRWRTNTRRHKKLQEFVFLRVADKAIKLFCNGSPQEITEIRAGQYIQIRHLRECSIKESVFYLSSLYTQYFFEPPMHQSTDSTLIIKGQHEYDYEETGIDNGLGYIPITCSTIEEYLKEKDNGLGLLYLNGNPIPRESSNSSYISKDSPYYGEVLSIADSKERASYLYIEETERHIVYGRITGIKYKELGDSIGENTFDISYCTTEQSLKELDDSIDLSYPSLPVNAVSFIEQLEECAIVRVEQNNTYIDIQIFPNHLFNQSFSHSVSNFLKAPEYLSVYDQLQQSVGIEMYFVYDVIRVNENGFLFLGVSGLKK